MTRTQFSEELKATPLFVKVFAGLFGITTLLAIGWATFVTGTLKDLTKNTNETNVAMIKLVENVANLKDTSSKHDTYLQMAFADLSIIKAEQSSSKAHLEHLLEDNALLKAKLFK